MYHPIQPLEKDVEWMRDWVKREQGKELSGQEAFQASYDFLNFFNFLLYLDNKQKSSEHQK